MVKNLYECDFNETFNTKSDGVYLGTYFREEIERRKWEFLLYGEDMFACDSLVAKFYASFGKADYNKAENTISVSWDGRKVTIDAKTIHEITGIPLVQQKVEEASIEAYLFIMGDNCIIPKDGGILASTMYRNVFTTARWLANNVIGTSHLTSFYVPTLHIIYCMMYRHNYDMCARLVKTIGLSKEKAKSSPPLAILVTFICKKIMKDDLEFLRICNESPSPKIKKEKVTISYKACLLKAWTISLKREDIIYARDVREEEKEFWAQEPNDHVMWEGMKKMNAKIDDLTDVVGAIARGRGGASSSSGGGGGEYSGGWDSWQ